MDITTTHVPGGRCPHCGTEMDACSGRNGKGPVPGNPVICFECGAIHTIDSDGTYRGFTTEELDTIIATPGYMEQLVAIACQNSQLPHKEELRVQCGQKKKYGTRLRS